jgi:hypothetical protein
VIKTLLERGLIKIIGKSDDVGQPLIYGTTREFLEMFGLKDLKDMPTLREIDDLLVQERVGDLGKEEFAEGEIQKGVGEVIDEYKEELAAFAVDPAKESEDNRAIQGLEDSIKQLRKLERVIFPKPIEEIKAVPREGEAEAAVPEVAAADAGGEDDEGASAQDTGAGD